MTLVDDIKNNSIEVLHLTEVPKDSFGGADTKEFCEAMSTNTSIKKVIFEKDFLSCAKGDDRANIVSSVGNLPNVESVILADSFLNIGVCVTNLVKNAKNLKELSMEKCVLQGVTDDFKLFSTTMTSNEHVKALRINNCVAPNDEVDLPNFFKDLKEGLNIEVSGAGGITC